ncbi:hypothetical protein [Devosia indica]
MSVSQFFLPQIFYQGFLNFKFSFFPCWSRLFSSLLPRRHFFFLFFKPGGNTNITKKTISFLLFYFFICNHEITPAGVFVYIPGGCVDKTGGAHL